MRTSVKCESKIGFEYGVRFNLAGRMMACSRDKDFQEFLKTVPEKMVKTAEKNWIEGWKFENTNI